MCYIFEIEIEERCWGEKRTVRGLPYHWCHSAWRTEQCDWYVWLSVLLRKLKDKSGFNLPVNTLFLLFLAFRFLPGDILCRKKHDLCKLDPKLGIVTSQCDIVADDQWHCDCCSSSLPPRSAALTSDEGEERNSKKHTQTITFSLATWTFSLPVCHAQLFFSLNPQPNIKYELKSVMMNCCFVNYVWYCFIGFSSIPTNVGQSDPQKQWATQETYDFWDIWSEWWEDMTWPN